MTNSDLVLITHEHVDHFDPDTLRPLALASPRARFAGPFTCDPARSGIAPDRWRRARAGEPFAELGGEHHVHPERAHRAGGRRARARVPGVRDRVERVTVYHPGDTVIWDGLVEALSAWQIDVAFFPSNGRDFFRTRRGIVGNMDVREAAQLTEELDVGLVVPTHYDLFSGNGADPGEFMRSPTQRG